MEPIVRRLTCVFTIFWMMSAVRALVISDANRDDLIMDTHDKLLNTHVKIIQVSTGKSSQEDLEGRLAMVELQVNKINKLYNASETNSDGSCAVAMQLLINHYNSIERQLKKLQLAVEKRIGIEEDSAREAENDIVNDIRQSAFQKAEAKLIAAGSNVEISKIVHEVYASSESNFKVIVNFAKGLSHISNSFQFLQSLDREMRANGHRNPINLIILAEALDTKVMAQHIGPNEIKTSSAAIINRLIDEIKNNTLAVLFEAMKTDDYQRNPNVHALSAALANYRPEVSDYVMQRLVNQTYSNTTLGPDRIRANIFSHSNTQQAISGMNALFRLLEKSNDLNNEVVLEISSDLSKLKARYDFTSLDQKDKIVFDNVVESLPTCARNLFLQPSVCLWNKENSTYLYAANASFHHDTERRNIFTSKNPPSGASWFVEKVGPTIFLRNTLYSREYLYAAEIDFENNRRMRHIFNWIPGGNTDGQSKWIVELSGNYCYLKSGYFYQYLHSSNETFKNNPYVLINKASVFEPEERQLWQIRTC